MTAIAPLVGKQRRSVELAEAHINIWEGSVRSSKTICSLLAWIRYARTGPAGNLAMIGKTERTLRRNVIGPLQEMLGPKRCKVNWGDGEMMLCGRLVYLAGANNEAAVSKIQGLTLAGAYVDEATLMPEQMWAMLLTRLSIEGAQLFATCNPDNPNHWLMRDYLRRASVWLTHEGIVKAGRARLGEELLDLARFSFRLADNPSLPATYIANLAKQFTGLWRKRFIEGLWVVAEGAIYDNFDPTPGAGTVITALPRNASGHLDVERWVIAVDYGTTNPFVAILGMVGADHITAAREWRWDSRARHSQKTDAQYSTALREWLASLEHDPEIGFVPSIDSVVVDPSAASFIVQLRQDGWPNVHGADNTVLDGIRFTAALEVAGRLFIHESCAEGIAEKTGYVWDEKAALAGEEKPKKEADHFPDAERYLVMDTYRDWRDWIGADAA